jgi:hypothetical protein
MFHLKGSFDPSLSTNSSRASGHNCRAGGIYLSISARRFAFALGLGQLVFPTFRTKSLACEVHAHKAHIHEVHAYEMHASEVHTHEVNTHEIHACKVHTHEMHAYEMHAYEVYAHEIHASEVHVHEVYTHEMYACKVHAYKMHAHKICTHEMTPMYTKAAVWATSATSLPMVGCRRFWYGPNMVADCRDKIGTQKSE